MARDSLAEMRLMIYELRPSVFEQEGLVAAIQARSPQLAAQPTRTTLLRQWSSTRRESCVVYGTSERLVQASIPMIEYSHNETGLTTFTAGVNLDQYIASNVGDYYPTISLESPTNKLYVLWLQSDTALVPKIVMGRVCSSGTWSNMMLSSDTSYSKQYLKSIYNVSSEFDVCWQWTQNTSSPIHVLFHKVVIPEFGDVVLPMMGVLVIVALSKARRRSRA